MTSSGKTGLELHGIGNRDVKATDCPGRTFVGRNGWKIKLIELADNIIKEKQKVAAVSE